MNFFEKIIYALDSEMITPKSYGLFHIMFIIFVIIGTILICRYFLNTSEKNVRIMVFICWVVIFGLELYKQIVFSFNYENNIVTWDYQWYAFPYQFCSTPMYALPFIVFLKDSKVRDSIIAFTSTFALFGGLVVMIYPGNVFIETIGINIQTMIHHGLQVVLGIFFTLRMIDKFNWKSVLKGAIVFSVFVVIAYILNITVYHIFLDKGIDESFNMFYISPYFDCELPILSEIYKNIPYPLFAGIYLIGFTLAAFIIYYLQIGIYKLVLKVKNIC